jgi:phosphatidate cytidylyltransferase
MALANRRASPSAARGRWIKISVFFLIVHLVLAVAAAGHPWIEILMLAVLIAGGTELILAWQRITQPRPQRIWAIYLLVTVLVINSAWHLSPEAFTFVFLVTATCDGFSQVIGQWLGRRPLVPKLSPGKTVGGLLGGLMAAMVVAILVRDYLHHGPATAAIIGLLAGSTGLAGDLAASWVKRRANIKDYSRALPGQGGFLDRFDSLLGGLAITGSILLAAG